MNRRRLVGVGTTILPRAIAMRMPHAFLLALVLSSWLAHETRGADTPVSEAKRTERLAQLCKLWGAVKYLHPYLAYKDIDWDAALIEALPRVRSAGNATEFAAAVQSMLDHLGDAATCVVGRRQPQVPEERTKPKTVGAVQKKSEPVKPKSELHSWVEKGVLAIDATSVTTAQQLFNPQTKTALAREIAKATAVILDLRVNDASNSFYAEFAVDQVKHLLPSRELQGPVHRYLVHSGYRPQSGMTSGGYFSAFESELAETFSPAADGKKRKVVFIINDKVQVPALAEALRQAGDGYLVAQGRVDVFAAGAQERRSLGEGIEVSLRTSETVGTSGLDAPGPDAEVAATADSGPTGPAFRAALDLIHQPDKSRPRITVNTDSSLSPARYRAERAYQKMTSPNLEYRLLALFRLWNVIEYFYPYKDLIGEDWNAVLTAFIPRLEKADTALAYALTLAELSTHVPDGHTGISGSDELDSYLGKAFVPLQLRLIEGAPVVTAVFDRKLAEEAGIRVGDIVVKVDGEPVEQRMARHRKYLAASTPGWHALRVVSRLLSGAEGSTAILEVRDASGRDKEVRVPRRPQTGRAPPRTGGEVFKVLPGEIGYVDLERLTVAQVDDMFERLKGTRAIIFDLRCYPQGTAWALAPRLNVKGARYGASFARQLVSARGTSEEQTTRFTFLQPLPVSDKWKYAGKTVTLIDERAISQAEHTGLFLEAACGTTFIGSPTAGANGDVTSFPLPGGLVFRFTGHDVRHADGRQLQRIGLVPHIEVKPTIKGIRDGRDEVLDRALAFLKEGK